MATEITRTSVSTQDAKELFPDMDFPAVGIFLIT